MKKDKLPRKIRLSVDSTVLQRAATIGKDSLLVNTYVDESASKTEYITKRSGFLLGISGTTNGSNYGIYTNPNTGNFYYIGSNGVPILGTPPNYWNNYTNYSIGQRVIFPNYAGGGNIIYTSTNNTNLNSPPSSTNFNWIPPATAEVLKASWTVAGMADPGGGMDQEFGVDFYIGATNQRPVFGLSIGVATPGGGCYVLDNINVSTNTGIFNGSWTVYQLASTLKFYFNGTLKMSIATALTIETPFTAALAWENGLFGGSITNIIIY